MSNSAIKESLAKALKELENSGDLVIVSPIENLVTNRLFKAVQDVSPSMLSTSELKGIINAVNAHQLDFKLDAQDFQTIIGLSKEELLAAISKLKI